MSKKKDRSTNLLKWKDIKGKSPADSAKVSGGKGAIAKKALAYDAKVSNDPTVKQVLKNFGASNYGSLRAQVEGESAEKAAKHGNVRHQAGKDAPSTKMAMGMRIKAPPKNLKNLPNIRISNARGSSGALKDLDDLLIQRGGKYHNN